MTGLAVIAVRAGFPGMWPPGRGNKFEFLLFTEPSVRPNQAYSSLFQQLPSIVFELIFFPCCVLPRDWESGNDISKLKEIPKRFQSGPDKA